MDANNTFALGPNNLRFNYSTKDLANPTIVAETFPMGFGETTLTGTNTETGIVSVNTAYTGRVAENLLPITKEGMDLVTVEFDVLTANPNTELTWRSGKAHPRTAVVGDDKMTTIEEGQLKGITFNQPVKIQPTVNTAVENFSVVSIAPNPTTDFINLSFKANESGKMDINLTDVTGKTVKIQHINATKGANLVTVDMKDLPSGAYFLAIPGQGKNSTQKVIKQ
jgi:hypothetical protein